MLSKLADNQYIIIYHIYHIHILCTYKYGIDINIVPVDV